MVGAGGNRTLPFFDALGEQLHELFQDSELFGKALEHFKPGTSPHTPSPEWHQVLGVVQLVPFGSPHLLSVVLHTFERQTVAVVQGRLFGSPHSLSPVSQTALTHTRVPTCVVHVPLIGAPGGTG